MTDWGELLLATAEALKVRPAALDGKLGTTRGTVERWTNPHLDDVPSPLYQQRALMLARTAGVDATLYGWRPDGLEPAVNLRDPNASSVRKAAEVARGVGTRAELDAARKAEVELLEPATWGEALRALRKRIGKGNPVPQGVLADLVGVHAITIGSWERGANGLGVRATPSPAARDKLRPHLAKHRIAEPGNSSENSTRAERPEPAQGGAAVSDSPPHLRTENAHRAATRTPVAGRSDDGSPTPAAADRPRGAAVGGGPTPAPVDEQYERFHEQTMCELASVDPTYDEVAEELEAAERSRRLAAGEEIPPPPPSSNGHAVAAPVSTMSAEQYERVLDVAVRIAEVRDRVRRLESAVLELARSRAFLRELEAQFDAALRAEDGPPGG